MKSLTRREFAISMGGAAVPVCRHSRLYQTGNTARPTGPDELAAMTLAQASDRIRARDVTATELMKACLARIDTYNPRSMPSLRSCARAPGRKRQHSMRNSAPEDSAVPSMGYPLLLRTTLIRRA